MTIREYNQLRRDIYDRAIQEAEVAQAIKSSGTAYIYEIEQGDKHAVLVLSHRSQLNDAVLRDRGISEPAAAEARLVLTLNQPIKSAIL